MTDCTSNIPYGYCQCGCGQKTTIPKQTQTSRGWVKGIPVRFISGHHPKNYRKTQPVEDRFWAKVAITEDVDQCWEWLAVKRPTGYGKFFYHGRTSSAHRVSWELINGIIPDGMIICHSCDNPKCVNPKHLFLGTNADNVKDKLTKGREAKGDKVVGAGCKNRHCVTAEQVKRIRELYKQGGVTTKELADDFNTSLHNIRKIIRRRTWKHVE